MRDSIFSFQTNNVKQRVKFLYCITVQNKKETMNVKNNLISIEFIFYLAIF